MNKKQTILASAGAVSALLVLGAGALAVKSWNAAGKAEEAMNTSRNALARMFKEPIFPSAANVETFETNLALANAWVADLSRGVFRDGIAPDPSVTRGDFPRVCREAVAALVAEAPLNAAEAPVVEADAAFGFEQYMGARLPAREEYVPRLMRQLRIVEKIVRLLYASGIHHLDAVGRETFDVAGERGASASADLPAGGRGRGRGRGSAAGAGPSAAAKTIAVSAPPFQADESVKMSRERFGFLFSTRQEGLVAALNAIDAMRPFAMVSGLSFSKTGADVLPPVPVEPAKEAAPPKDEDGILEKPAPRTARLVSGPLFETPVQVTLFVDIYAPASAVGPAAGADDEAVEAED